MILFGAVAFAAVAVGLHSAQGQTQPSAPETLKPPAGEYLRAHDISADFEITPELLDEFKLYCSQHSIQPSVGEWSLSTSPRRGVPVVTARAGR